MSVAVLLVTHENIGGNILSMARAILNEDAENIDCVEVPMDSDTDAAKQNISDSLDQLSTDEGVLIITDSYGSTPCNLASEFLDSNTLLVSGINLPMILRLMNYRDMPLHYLGESAADGGKNGVRLISN